MIFELSQHDTILFEEVKSQIENITNASLSSALRDWEDNGFVSRKQFNEISPYRIIIAEVDIERTTFYSRFDMKDYLLKDL